MSGGDGNDYYIVDNKNDIVLETNSRVKTGGLDTIETVFSYTLVNNVENLVLTGIANNTGAGNRLDNVIKGNVGDNLLSGEKGNDSLIGGDGDDTLNGGLGMDTLVDGNGSDVYIMNNAEDKIIELDDAEGEDEVIANVSYDLNISPNVEVLTLSGSKAINGIGNDLDNVLQEVQDGTFDNNFNGMAGDDIINAEGGDDTLEGGEGDDELNGGEGEDVTIYNDVEDAYLITSNFDVDGVAQLVIEYVGSNENNMNEGTDILNDI